ncbi:protein ApaG [Brucella sp. 63/311]|nr:protein ApaG [Brucella sp. 63/311]
MYSAVTRGIEVTVEPFYLEVQSEPEENRYVWGYRVTIVNNSSETVQLCSRYWQITDANGHVRKKCAVQAWSASSLFSIRAIHTSILPVSRSQPRQA